MALGSARWLPKLTTVLATELEFRKRKPGVAAAHLEVLVVEVLAHEDIVAGFGFIAHCIDIIQAANLHLLVEGISLILVSCIHQQEDLPGSVMPLQEAQSSGFQ